MLVQIYKGKGLKELLENNRYIHSKPWKPKLFESMVVAKIKPKIFEKTSKFQIGGTPGHRPQEHIFVVKSVISFYIMTGQALILTAFDIQKYFDKESLRDCMNSLYKAGIKGKNYRLFFYLNKNSNIRIKTGVGISEERSIGENIGQGTIGGALVSGQNLDCDIFETFEKCTSEVCYGSVRMQPVLYQDDLIRMVNSVEGAQEGNYRVEAAMKSKPLIVHPDKSVYLLAGNRSMLEKINLELKKNPSTYSEFNLKNKEQEKWFGEQLRERGSRHSVLATIKEKKVRPQHPSLK